MVKRIFIALILLSYYFAYNVGKVYLYFKNKVK